MAMVPMFCDGTYLEAAPQAPSPLRFRTKTNGGSVGSIGTWSSISLLGGRFFLARRRHDGA